MKSEVQNKPIRVLVEVKHLDGTSHYEWRDVPGTEISFQGVSLKNGETLSVSYTVAESDTSRR